MRFLGLLFIGVVLFLWNVSTTIFVGYRRDSWNPARIDRTAIIMESAVPAEFYDLAEKDYPAAFAAHLGRATFPAYADALIEGRSVYVREGCQNCHTQFVREGTFDEALWGRASSAPLVPRGVPGAFPAVIGSRRVGPDLARLSNRYSNDWHAAHLYSPRALLPDSVMPGYPWLFEEREGRMQPNREGLALIIYLQSLGSEIPEDRR